MASTTLPLTPCHPCARTNGDSLASGVDRPIRQRAPGITQLQRTEGKATPGPHGLAGVSLPRDGVADASDVAASRTLDEVLDIVQNVTVSRRCLCMVHGRERAIVMTDRRGILT